VDYETDILFFRGPVPGVERWGEIPKIYRPKGPAFCCPDHIGRDDLLRPKWLQLVQRLCLTIEVAVSFSLPKDNEDRWKRLRNLCPALKELIILFGDSLGSECMSKDLVLMSWSGIPDPADFRNTVLELQLRTRHAQSIGVPIRSYLEGRKSMSRIRLLEHHFCRVGR
jgi:hypothetical protein